MVIHAYNSSTWDMEAGGQFEASMVNKEFKASLDYI